MAIEQQVGVTRRSTDHFFETMLRNDFKNVVTETLRDPNTLLGKMMGLSKTQHFGKAREWRTHYGRSTGNNAIGADGRLPDPGRQKYGKYFASFRSIRARILVDQLLSNLSRSQVAAWAESIGTEMTRLVDDNKYLMNRMLHGDGSGIVAEIATYTSGPSASLTLKVTPSAARVLEGSTYLPNYDPSVWLREGKTYVSINPGSSTINSVFTLDSITSSTAVGITVNHGTPAANDVIVECSSADVDLTGSGATFTENVRDTAFAREIMGMAGFCSDAGVPNAYSSEDVGFDTLTGFQGVAVTGLDYNQAIVDDLPSGSRPLTSQLLHNVIAKYHKKNLIRPTQATMSYEMANAFYQMLVNERIFVQTGSMSPAYNGEIDNFDLKWGKITFTPDKEALPHRIYFWNPSCLEWLMVREWDWIDRDGSIFSRLPDREKYQATMVWDGNLYTKLRRELMVVTNLQEA